MSARQAERRQNLTAFAPRLDQSADFEIPAAFFTQTELLDRFQIERADVGSRQSVVGYFFSPLSKLLIAFDYLVSVVNVAATSRRLDARQSVEESRRGLFDVLAEIIEWCD